MNKPLTSFSRQWNLRLTLRERILLYERLSLFLRSGIPIIQALEYIRGNAERRSARTVLHHTIDDVMHGKSLASSMQRLRGAFPPFESHLVELGEHGGNLPESLAHLATLLRRRRELTQTLVQALMYPALIATGTLLVSGFLVLFAFPKIVPIFKSLHVPLPFMTRFLITLSGFLTESWHLVLTGFLGAILIFLVLLRVPKTRVSITRFQLALPLLGSLIRTYYIATISRTLALMLVSGIPLLPALSLTARGMRHPQYKQSLEMAAQHVRDGGKLADALGLSQSLYPPATTQLISAGEATGTLPVCVRTIAELYEVELTERTRLLTSLIEPLLMIGMGLVVGFVAIAIIAPIYGITQNLSPH